jgi:uncharacterized protein (TIGR02466 family)
MNGYIHEIFQVPIYETQLNLDSKKLLNICTKFSEKHESRERSNFGGYQAVFTSQHNEVKALMQDIQDHAQAFSETFLGNKRLEWGVDSIWLNVNWHKDCNMSHSHPMADISGVYYVKTPKNSGELVFQHPVIDVLNYYYFEKEMELNNCNSRTWTFQPIENTMYLFPSWLKHVVTPNENKKEERISIAFNLKHEN